MVFIKVLCSLIRAAVATGLLLHSSCTAYREYSFETAIPAEHTLEGGRKIGFLDRQSYKPAIDTLIILNGIELTVGSGQMATVFRNGFYSCYAETYPLDSLPVIVTEEMKQWDSDTTQEALLPSDVMRICRKNGLDYLLSWESFRYKSDPVKHSVTGYALVCLYSGKDGKEISFRWLENEFADCFSAGNGFYGEGGYTEGVLCMQGKMWDKGYWYAQKWVPGWRKTERRIYVAPKTVGVGEFYYREGDKERAAGIWQAAVSGKPKTALRAYLNLALMCELEEDFEGALAWLRKAQQRIGTAASGEAAYVKMYVRELETRLKNRPLLEGQLF